jgi:hypothetical protein
MAAIGIDQNDMARLLKIAPKTLRKHFRDELDLGMVRANAAVGGALFKAATTPGPGMNAAAIFWAKARMGWREQPTQIEHSGTDGNPIEVRQITRVIVRPGSPDVTTKGKRKKED